MNFLLINKFIVTTTLLLMISKGIGYRSKQKPR